jgi:hypothetical protein
MNSPKSSIFFVTSDTVTKFIKRNLPFRTIAGIPTEEKRVKINHDELLAWYKALNDIIWRIPRFFLYYMDETDLDDWVDSREVTVVVPTTHATKETAIPIKRSCKRATLTACVAADGTSLKPLVIISSGSIAEDIEEAGFTKDKVVFIHQNHRFMTKLIFQFWCQEIFFPYVFQKRREFPYGGRAILLMDQFSGHEYEGCQEECTKYGVVSTPLVPHTSHLSQLPAIELLESSKHGI